MAGRYEKRPPKDLYSSAVLDRGQIRCSENSQVALGNLTMFSGLDVLNLYLTVYVSHCICRETEMT